MSVSSRHRVARTLPRSLRFTEITKRLLAGFLARYDPRVGDCAREISCSKNSCVNWKHLRSPLRRRGEQQRVRASCTIFARSRIHENDLARRYRLFSSGRWPRRENAAREAPSTALSYRAFVGGSGGTARISRDVRRISEKYCIPLPIVYFSVCVCNLAAARGRRNSQN